MVALGTGGNGPPTIGRVGRIDEDAGFHETPHLRRTGALLELDGQAVARGPARGGTGRAPQRSPPMPGYLQEFGPPASTVFVEFSPQVTSYPSSLACRGSMSRNVAVNGRSLHTS